VQLKNDFNNKGIIGLRSVNSIEQINSLAWKHCFEKRASL